MLETKEASGNFDNIDNPVGTTHKLLTPLIFNNSYKWILKTEFTNSCYVNPLISLILKKKTLCY